MQEGSHIMLIHAISHLRIPRMKIEEIFKVDSFSCIRMQHKSKYELNRITWYEIFIHSSKSFSVQVKYIFGMEKCTFKNMKDLCLFSYDDNESYSQDTWMWLYHQTFWMQSSHLEMKVWQMKEEMYNCYVKRQAFLNQG